MTDDATKRGHPDTDLISLQQEHEVRYWIKELRVTREQLREAVKAVGHSAEKVREYVAEVYRDC